MLDSYLLRSLAVAGYAPSFDHCVRCGDEGPHRWFNPSAGGVMCASMQAPRLRDPLGRHAGRSSARCSPVTGRSSTPSEPRQRKEASGLVAAYLAWHLERGLRSLAYVER